MHSFCVAVVFVDSKIVTFMKLPFYLICFRCEVIEPPRGKTNNVVSEQVRHKPACTSTEAG